MLLQPELLHLCQSTIAKIQAVLTARHVSIQRSIAGGWRSLTADLPSDISGDLSDSVGQRLHALEVVYFKIATKVGPIKVAGDCLLLPIACHQQLWGRVCIINTPQAWQPHDINWLIAISQLLGQAISLQESSANELVPTDLDLEEPLMLETSPASYDQAYLEQQIAILIEQDQIKDEFISKISHDLRAPLMNMRMALKMFKIGTSRDPAATAVIANEKYSKYLNILETECEREIGLINNVLDLQKLETGNVSLELQSIDLVDWLPTVVETFQTRITESQQQLELVLPERPASILIDEASLQRILSELLNNACKYTANHKSIRCELEYPINHSQPIYLVVGNAADIAPTDLPLIFERFYRVPSTDHQKQGGTGLGLSLVQSLVEQLHGQIVVQSINGWTTFTVALPIKPPVTH